MKILRIIGISLCTFIASHASAQAGTHVVVSIKPIHSLISGVMADVGRPSLIIKGAMSPHTSSLTPSQARLLEDADLMFWVGHELETFLEKPFSTLGNGVKQIELLEAHGLTTHGLREGGNFEAHEHEHEAEHKENKSEEHKHEHEHGKKAEHSGDTHAKHHDEDIDAHIWLDPQNAKAIVHEVVEALIEFDPKNAAVYEKNAKRMNAKLDALTNEVQDIVAPVRSKGFIVFHDGFQYFEKRFDIIASGAITINPEVPPSVGRVQEIRNKVRELGATCVFAEPQFEPKIIKTVTEGTSAKIGVLDPLGADLSAGPELYFDLIRNMARSLKDCLSAKN